jgi:hypothetical protein
VFNHLVLQNEHVLVADVAGFVRQAGNYVVGQSRSGSPKSRGSLR